MKFLSFLSFLSAFSLLSCNNAPPATGSGKAGSDPHSFARPEEAVTKHLTLDLTVDFEEKIFAGTAKWDIENKGADRIIFDTDGLKIKKVTIDDGKGEKETGYDLKAPVEYLGRALEVEIEPSTKVVTIEYETSKDAAAVLWLEPEQTAGKELPFVFTQGQAILTRSWIPCQDSPGVRVTYDATMRVPPSLLAVMSTINPTVKNANGVYQFHMEMPVSPYLIAFAAGDLVFQKISSRSGVYAEPSMSDDAFFEFNRIESMIKEAEEIFGPYPWGRYDLLVLPPSFPFGGMENPRLTFVTPTIIAGDHSLVSLVAHELAHSWSGNLVTNATWNDFWLNEGLTTYTERRIMEALNGEEYFNMLALIGYQDLEADLKDLGRGSADTHLRLDLEGRDPDDGMTDVAYEKGAFFFYYLEKAAGRENFDTFLKGYFDTYKFKTITTDEFIRYLDENLVKKHNLDVNVKEWIDAPGIPVTFPHVASGRFERVEQAVQDVKSQGKVSESIHTRSWTAHEWVHFIRHLPQDLDNSVMKRLDYAYDFSDSQNSEIQAAWYELSIYNGYSQEILPQIEAFLIEVGRRKFLMPIYRAFKERGQVETARDIYKKARPNYHAVSTGSLDELLG